MSRAIRSAWLSTVARAVTVVVLRDLVAAPSTSSIGWLNHFSVLLRISSLPTMSTRTRRHDRQPEEGQHQLGAEARERQAAATLDHQLDDVARQDEHQRDEHRQVGRRERVEDDLGQEVGVELGRAVGEADHRDERGEEQQDAEEDQARIVAERTALGARVGMPGGQRRAGRLADGAHVAGGAGAEGTAPVARPTGET